MYIPFIKRWLALLLLPYYHYIIIVLLPQFLLYYLYGSYTFNNHFNCAAANKRFFNEHHSKTYLNTVLYIGIFKTFEIRIIVWTDQCCLPDAYLIRATYCRMPWYCARTHEIPMKIHAVRMPFTRFPYSFLPWFWACLVFRIPFTIRTCCCFLSVLAFLSTLFFFAVFVSRSLAQKQQHSLFTSFGIFCCSTIEHKFLKRNEENVFRFWLYGSQWYRNASVKKTYFMMTTTTTPTAKDIKQEQFSSSSVLLARALRFHYVHTRKWAVSVDWLLCPLRVSRLLRARLLPLDKRNAKSTK